jgi:hypothetical protein
MVKGTSPIRLKARLILLKATRTDEFDQVGNPLYSAGTAGPFLVTFAPIELKGKPTDPQPTPEEIGKGTMTSLEFDVVDEPWCDYSLTDGTLLRLRLVISGIHQTSFYSSDGDPLLWVNHNMIISTVVPKELRKPKGAITPINR